MTLIYKIMIVNAVLLLGITIAEGQHLSDANLIFHSSPIENSLILLQQLKSITFEYQPETVRKLQLESGPQMGLLPREIKTVFSGLINKTEKLALFNKNSCKALTLESVDISRLTPVLVQAVQQQEEKINSLKKDVDNLKKHTSK